MAKCSTSGFEAAEMKSNSAVAEFAGEEENPIPTPPSPVEDMLVDIEETAEKLFFSDEDDAFPLLADFPCLSSPSASPSLSSPASIHSKHVPHLSIKASSTTSSETDAMHAHPLHSPAAAAEGFELELELEDSLVSVDAGLYILEDEINPWETCTEEPFIFSGETAVEEKVGFLCGGEDLATVFLDWLKRNKDSISPEDLRSIKLKRSTIECAARRLGGGKQGNVQLLKLILDWVQNHHLHMRRRRSRGSEAAGRNQDFYNRPSPPPLNTNHLPFPQEPTTCNPNINFYYESPHCNFYTGEPSFPALMPCYRSETMPLYHYYQNQVFSAEPWQQGLTPAAAPPPPHFPVYYPGLMASATKEARKKRMARHRRSFSRQRYRSQQQRQNQQNLDTEESSSAHSINVDKDGSFFLAAAAAAFPPATTQVQQESYLHRHSSSAGERRREGMKEEKNYRFLLQKVLKQSDVGSLGRIVLPKKEAEINLPELVTRDGISIEMEDIGTSRVYNMRYRFWPNNKSRMYLLENTGDFVRSNGLEEGDFIVIYSDVKCGKYMIRGVKVRQPMEMVKGGSNSNSGKAQPLL